MYQRLDHEVIDYGLSDLADADRRIRGPLPPTLAAGDYFTCLGGAQTFGRFCKRPYPFLLAQELKLAALNLGFPGAGPRFFVNQPALVDYANRGRFAIVQVMSARSEDNSLVDSGGLELVVRRSDGKEISAARVYEELLTTQPAKQVRAVLAETRANWIACYRRLLGEITVPTVLFWFSRRTPDYQERLTDLDALYGEFPQFVNRAMVEEVKPLADSYVECITSRGTPTRLVSRFTGAPVSIDFGGFVSDRDPYYPSPEMHEDAALSCFEPCADLAQSGRLDSNQRQRGR